MHFRSKIAAFRKEEEEEQPTALLEANVVMTATAGGANEITFSLLVKPGSHVVWSKNWG